MIFLLLLLPSFAQDTWVDRLIQEKDTIVVLTTTKCPPCNLFKLESAREPLKSRLRKYKVVALDDKKPVERAKYLKKYGIKSYPAFIFERKQIAYKIIVGYNLRTLIEEL